MKKLMICLLGLPLALSLVGSQWSDREAVH